MTRTRTRREQAAAIDTGHAGEVATAPTTRWVRTPTSLLHLVLGLVLMGLGTLVAWRYANAAAAVNADGEAMFRGLPGWLRALPVAVVDSVLVVAPVAVNVALLVRRRFRLLAMVDAAAVGAVVLSDVVVGWVTRVPPDRFPDAYLLDGVADTPNQPLLAGFLAALVVGLPWLSDGQRRLATGVLALHFTTTMVFGELPVVSWVLDVGSGIVAGSLVALAVGTPDRRPDRAELVAALARSGIAATDLRPAAVDARGSTPWFADTATHGRLFVKVLDRDHRSADLLFRLVRFVRLRRTGDRAPFTSLRRTVEHEALLSLRATSVGITTPELVAVSEVGTDGMLLAYRFLAGASLDSVPDEALTDDVLDAVWSLVADLRRAGIAHRDLRLANLFLGEDGRARLIDFGFAELAAPELLLATDVAELLASTAPRVGVRRAVDAAERVVGLDVLAEALPRVQPLALGSATRTALMEDGLLTPLREEVRTRCGLEEVTYEELARVRPRTLGVVATATLGLWALAPELADARGVVDRVLDARWELLPWVVLAVVVVWVGGALSLQGTVAGRLRAWPALLAQVAAARAAVSRPGVSGRLALHVRFLQKAGVDREEAATAVGVEALVGVAVNVALLFLALETADRRGTVSLSVPALVAVAALVAGFVVLGAVASLVPSVRRLLQGTVLPGIARAAGATREAAGRPGRLALLVGGTLLGTLAGAAALVLSVRIMGGTTPVIVVTVVALVGALVMAASPTPGGLVLTEVALVVGLRTAGESTGVAVPAVFLFRLAAFWVPILPAWWATRRLEAADAL